MLAKFTSLSAKLTADEIDENVAILSGLMFGLTVRRPACGDPAVIKDANPSPSCTRMHSFPLQGLMAVLPGEINIL
jgi:hypothetical protein